MSFYVGCRVACYVGDVEEATGVVSATGRSEYPWWFESDDDSGIAFSFTSEGWRYMQYVGNHKHQHVIPLPSNPNINKFFSL